MFIISKYSVTYLVRKYHILSQGDGVMKKGIIVNLKRFKLLDYVTLNKIFILLCALFIVGITLGSTVISKNGWISKNTDFLFTELIALHTDNSFFKKIFSCFLRYIVILFFYFLSGASMLGIVVTPFITVWHGIFVGSIISYIYSSYGINGIAFNAIILILPTSIFTVLCFFAARSAIDFSFSIVKLTMPKSRPTNLNNQFKNYCGKYLIFVGVTFICSLIEIILNIFFLKIFNF